MDTYDQQALAADFQRLGLTAGDTVFVHSALSTLGHVEGGADTVIAALLSVVGHSGTLAAPARTRPKREGARGGRGAEKLDAPSAAATPQPGPGRARTAELATARRPRPMPTPARRDRTAAGPVSAVDARTVVGAARRAAGAAERRGAAAAARGLQRRGPARPSRGRAWAAVTRRVACVRSARSAHGPKTLALRARGARARGKKRRAGVLGRRRRPRRETASVKGVDAPFWGRSASSGTQ